MSNTKQDEQPRTDRAEEAIPRTDFGGPDSLQDYSHAVDLSQASRDQTIGTCGSTSAS
jgi:hypothetical protein